MDEALVEHAQHDVDGEDRGDDEDRLGGEGLLEGLRRADDTLPRRFLAEPIPDGPSKGMVMSAEVLEKLKDEYYSLRGWDTATGIPLPERLYALDLTDIAEDMRKILSSGKGA